MITLAELSPSEQVEYDKLNLAWRTEMSNAHLDYTKRLARINQQHAKALSDFFETLHDVQRNVPAAAEMAQYLETGHDG